MKQYHTLVLIGRFQPVHSAHAEIIRRAAKMAKQVIIIVGSANQPRTYKNPWTSKDRELMLQNVINEIDDTMDECMIRVEHNIDTVYNDTAWASRVQAIVGKLSAAQIIDPSELDAAGRVVFGSTVELEEEETGERVKYQIVGEDEADLKLGLVNISSPIARALIGKEEGDTAVVQAPGGLKSYEIVAVHYI